MLKKNRFLKVSFLLFLFLNSSACYLNLRGVNTRFNLPSVGDDFSPSDSEYFYIDLDVESYESNDELVPYYEISTTEDYGDSETRKSPSNCEIEYVPPEDDDEEQQTSETLVCILDVPEGEFKLKSLRLVYNFPDGMCNSIYYALPWHFNFPIKPGPVVKQCPVTIGSGDDASEVELFCNADYDRQTGQKECPTNANKRTCHIDKEDLCPSLPGDPKCCSGGDKADEGEEQEEWKPEKECFGGPALHAGLGEPPKALIPRDIEIPEGGLRQTIILTHLLGISLTPQNVFHANYLKALDISPDDLETLNREDKLPDFFHKSPYYKPHIPELSTPRLFFEFACLDPAEEVLHKISFMIREWNTLEEFLKFYYDGGNDEADPDVEGKEGEDCNNEGRRSSGGEFSEQCNDWKDLDDFSSYPQIVIEDEETKSN